MFKKSKSSEIFQKPSLSSNWLKDYSVQRAGYLN